MSDVELVIKIPETLKDIADKIDVKTFSHLIWQSVLVDAIKNGIPLPKGHGDIIDRNQIEYLKAIHDAIYGHIPWSEATKKIRYSAPTIVEADTENVIHCGCSNAEIAKSFIEDVEAVKDLLSGAESEE